MDDKTLPSTANFHPSLTLLGTQPSFVVGMEGGDIVKCNTTASRSAVSHKSVIPFERQTVIHERVRVELFKAHNCKVGLGLGGGVGGGWFEGLANLTGKGGCGRDF